MEWAKIKNIIILILILLNVVLLFLVAQREIMTERSLQTARNNAIEVIRSNGVTLQDETVPREMKLQPMQVVRELEQERKLAAELLGENVAVEARGGDVYRYYSDAGWIQFHNAGEFSAEFSEDVVPMAGRDPVEHAAAVLKQIGFDGQLLKHEVENGAGTISFRQELDTVPILGCQATLVYADGQLRRIEDGCRLNGTPSANVEKSTISVATALMRLFNGMRELGDIYNQIESITPAYNLSVDLSGMAGLTPIWYVKTDTATYQLDATTGAISRVMERGSQLYSEAEPTGILFD